MDQAFLTIDGINPLATPFNLTAPQDAADQAIAIHNTSARAEEAAGLRFAGYAALFDTRDAGRDTIRPGAFARSLRERQAGTSGPLPLYWQHRPNIRIGWIEAASEDARGLRVLARIDNPAGSAAAALKAGKVTGLSFGYRARLHPQCQGTRAEGHRAD